VSHQHEGHNNVEEISGVDQALPLIFDRPGEYEVKDIFINGIGSYHDKKEGANEGKSTIFRFDIGGVNVVHLGDLGVMLSNQQIDKLGDVDVLLVPVGGKKTLDAKEAAELVRILEPRIVIPMHYKIEGMEGDLDGLERFKKEMGDKSEVLPKLKISKKDLPQEDTKLIILEKS
jgi:L-ascorbate metabolism protein UlaG (beta-lactamase superfamily)